MEQTLLVVSKECLIFIIYILKFPFFDIFVLNNWVNRWSLTWAIYRFHTFQCTMWTTFWVNILFFLVNGRMICLWEVHFRSSFAKKEKNVSHALLIMLIPSMSVHKFCVARATKLMCLFLHVNRCFVFLLSHRYSLWSTNLFVYFEILFHYSRKNLSSLTFHWLSIIKYKYRWSHRSLVEI